MKNWREGYDLTAEILEKVEKWWKTSKYRRLKLFKYWSHFHQLNNFVVFSKFQEIFVLATFSLRFWGSKTPTFAQEFTPLKWVKHDGTIFMENYVWILLANISIPWKTILRTSGYFALGIKRIEKNWLWHFDFVLLVQTVKIIIVLPQKCQKYITLSNSVSSIKLKHSSY